MSSKEKVKNFMISANRPYSANDIQSNLGQDVTKNGVQKSLDQLVAENVIFEKVYGKQKVYCAVQENKENAENTEENEEVDLDDKINVLKKILGQLENEYKLVESNLKDILSVDTTDNLEKENRELIAINAELKQKLETLKGSIKETKPVDKSEYEKITKQKNSIIGDYRKRKRICNDVLYQILEGYPKTKKHLYEEIGIEEDPQDMPKLV